MLYMFAAMPSGHGMESMPGMAGGMSLQYPQVAVLLGLLLIAYAWTTTVQLLGLATVSDPESVGRSGLAVGCAADRQLLAPRIAACCEAAMGIAMVYPLIALA